MLEYSKTILEKVSFDRFLFEKEYRKALTMLTPREGMELRNWTSTKFNRYRELISRVSSNVIFDIS